MLYINPALLDVLHNDGPNPDPTYKSIPRDPKLVYIYLSTPQSLHVINQLRRQKIIKQNQYELMFPPGCVETDSQISDPTLNQVMVRNFTTLKIANWFWKNDKILPCDISVAVNTVRALAFINFVYHYGNPAAMEKPKCEIKCKQADNILKGLRYKGNIGSVKTMSLDQEMSVLKALNNQV